jgi:hypothetical protein
MARKFVKVCEICEEEPSNAKLICPLGKRLCTACASDPDKCDWDEESESCWEKCEHPFA